MPFTLPPAPAPNPPIVRPVTLPPAPTPNPPTRRPFTLPPAPTPNPPSPMPEKLSSAPTPSTPSPMPWMRRAPVTGKPSAKPFTTPRAGVYGVQIVTLMPMTSRIRSSRKFRRTPRTNRESPMLRPVLLIIRSRLCAGAVAGTSAASTRRRARSDICLRLR